MEEKGGLGVEVKEKQGLEVKGKQGLEVDVEENQGLEVVEKQAPSTSAKVEVLCGKQLNACAEQDIASRFVSVQCEQGVKKVHNIYFQVTVVKLLSVAVS